jgi:hypothetical protein
MRFLNQFKIIIFAILCYSQNDNDPHEDLAKFGYKINVNFF